MGNIIIGEYKPEFKDEWDDFVDNSNNGTMFHKQAFLNYHEPGKFNFNHLMFKKEGELIGVLPGGLTDEGEVFWSPVGASYGSIVTKDIAYRHSLELIDKLMEYSKDMNFRDIYLIPPPIIYNKVYNQHIEYSMLYRKFDYEYSYISHAIDLKIGKDYLNHFDKTARKTIRKIIRENKIVIKESEDYESFNEILINNKAKHNIKPTHTLEDMLKLKELMPRNLKLFMVYYEGKPIAGSWLFLCNEKVSLCFYNMLLYEYEHLKPIYLIMDEVTRWSIENGYEWVDIGVSQDTSAEDPMTPSLNLIYFKERFHSRGLLRTTFHYKFRD
ncbi:GNAT family N-acetyltransferase [Bacteroidota bacterium]